MTAPLLVLGWGNPSRGDDALGPMLVDALAAYAGRALPAGAVDCLSDYQLQIEHALDLVGRERVLFVDAAVGLDAAFAVSAVQPQRERQITSHALSPPALLQVFVDLQGCAPPECSLLALRGRRWALGEVPDAAACEDLARALEWATGWLERFASPQVAEQGVIA
ncbi:hydrogenase maturation protease [Methyloversatilis sp.]|uniref:hydrogenase maturation protease n=1 Tax=Methyloversatilis sp. TaxID=2569862 RepID=UPI002736E518|nr:hydrogenase maturation protease [Methyloversatilis sp.]MDP2869148.1 hydrogenase maturation protease [Methyloversatilis sp.]MDP3287223.1 hydrogenase maturation protease [Methyloversatilis sp.]MDP3457185.1 hydrogenase maturation protease [Methyloversatilis sp.]MDP3579836.1 hydrogenase maturation protease [Methyloversatilis sp.]